MSRSLIFLAIFLFCSLLITGAFAGVYKRVNPDGSVEFTDIPEEVGAKPIEVSPSSTYSPPPLPTSATSEKSAFTGYESLTITNPANDAVVRENQGNLTVSLSSEPGLQAGHSYVLLMDGNQVSEGSSGQFELNDIDRGSHTFIGQVVDQEKTMLLQSQPVTVHLHRASSQHPNKRSGNPAGAFPKFKN